MGGVGMATKSPEQVPKAADPVKLLKQQQQIDAVYLAAKQKQFSDLIQERVNPKLGEYGLPPMSKSDMNVMSEYLSRYHYVNAVLNAKSLDDVKASYSYMKDAYAAKLNTEKTKLKQGKIREPDFKELKDRYKSDLKELKQGVALAKHIENLTEDILNHAEKIRLELEKSGLSERFWGGMYGQVVEHAMAIRVAAWRLALNMRSKEVQQLADSIDPSKAPTSGSVNLKDYGFIDRDYYMMTSVENFMIYGFHQAIMSLQPTERSEFIRQLNQVKFGNKIGSLLFDNVDIILTKKQGANSPELIKIKKDYSPQAQLIELRRIAKDGFVHSMFDPEYGNFPLMADANGMQNAMGAKYGYSKLLKYGIGISLTAEKSRLNESPKVYGNFAFITGKMETEFWPRLISAVKFTEANEAAFTKSVNLAQVTAEMAFYTMQTVYKKSFSEIILELANEVNQEGGQAQFVRDDNQDLVYVKDIKKVVPEKTIAKIYEAHLAALPEVMLVTYAAAFDGQEHVMHSYGFGDVSAENKNGKAGSIDELIKELSKESDAKGPRASINIDEGFRRTVKETINTCVDNVNQQFMPFDAVIDPGPAGSGIVRTTVTLLPNKKEDYLLDPEFDLKVTDVKLDIPFLFGLNLPFIKASYPRLAKELSFSYTGFKSLPKDNVFEKTVKLPSNMISNWNGIVTLKTVGKNIAPTTIERAFTFDAPPMSPMSLPVSTSQEVKIGFGGIGGVVAGMASRYGQSAVDHLLAARKNEQNLMKDPMKYSQNFIKDPKGASTVTKEMFLAIKAAADFDPSMVGGAATVAWINANETSVMEKGEIDTSPPAALMGSSFGQEMSFTVIPDSFKHERVATMSDIDITFKKTAKGTEFYFKTGVMSVTEHFRYATASYDDNGNPVITQHELPVEKKDYPLAGLGTFMPGAKLKAEFAYTSEGERIVKTMSTEDKDIVQKAFALFAKDWDAGLLGVTGKKTSQIVGLFEELSFSYLNKRWTLNGRAEVAKLPLTQSLLWISGGKVELPLELNYKTSFTAETDPDEGFTGFKFDKKLGHVLDLSYRTLGTDVSVWDFFANDPTKPTAIGLGMTARDAKIGRSLYDITLGLSLSRQAGDEYLDINKDVWSNSQKSVHVSISWGPNPNAPKKEKKSKAAKSK